MKIRLPDKNNGMPDNWVKMLRDFDNVAGTPVNPDDKVITTSKIGIGIGTSNTVEPKDTVNKPAHYNQGSIEAIDYIKDSMSYEAFVGYLEGNVKKYLHRYTYKNGTEDLKKAQWYLAKLIETIEMKDKTIVK